MHQWFAGMTIQEEKNSRKHSFRGVCGAVITIVASCLFTRLWLSFIQTHNQTGHLLGKANVLMMLGIYTALMV